MLRKLHHPLWMHLPAVISIAAAGILLATAGMPDRVPVHFGTSGVVDRWGHAWELWLAAVALPLALTAGSAVVDEIFARQELKPTWTWLGLLDEVFAGFSLAMVIHLRPQFGHAAPTLAGLWPTALALVGANVAAAAVLETLRPHRISPPPAHSVDTAEAAAQLPARGRWVHWEAQNPIYARIVIVVTVVVMVGVMLAIGRALPWINLPLGLSVLLLAGTYGGFQVVLGPEQLRVRLGLLGIPLLRVKLSDIRSAEPMNFSPLADFGGWGVRYSLRKKMWGYYLCGRRGVCVETAKGRKYLIGSSDADRLAALCRRAAGIGA